MMTLIQSVLAFIVALGILVTIHEFGHFWVARRLGVKILRFSVGFGKAVWTRRFGPDNTEFVLAAIPLGGYVKMLDEREGKVPKNELDRAFNRQSLGTRFAVVVAGPGFNFLFAIFAYWLMFTIGVSGMKPIIAEVEPGSIAERAGFEKGHQILSIDDQPTPTWSAFIQSAIGGIFDSGEMVVTVQKGMQSQDQLTLDMSAVHVDDLSRGDLLERIGLTGYRPPAVIGEVIKGGAADAGGIRSGDLVVSADGQEIRSWQDWVNYVRARPEVPIEVELMRAEQRVDVNLRPASVKENGEVIGMVGVKVDLSGFETSEYVGIEKYSGIGALSKAFLKTWEASALTLKVLGKIITGQASVKNLSGPISIAEYAGKSASIGLTAFLAFLAIVSVSLGVLNLLPIPVLDGGHLMYYLVELISRRPVSEAVQLAGQHVGIVFLVGLMGVAFYNDIMRLF